ncbi:uncharacterized protein DUF2017 [Microbacterium sp. AG790]|uniref:DUF2017 family protein n=1 Tax=Microbacterium sp. AG790 TaxID=2183995 RepID=UPI000EAD6E65|nr:DUF2017 family protein [Microbacterium sp. AG790]RKS86148.1 uncharacterized protein DUF2017 [Microbacterium sp. AG790]
MTAVRMEVSALEAAHLTDLVLQFTDLLAESIDRTDDPAIARLVPDGYRDAPDDAAEFRRLTQDDLLDRRRDDAAVVLTTLQRDGRPLRPEDLDRADAEVEVIVELDAGAVTAWLRTLTAVRLVMATRLGITTEEEQDDDPRFGVYNWLGFRLEGLLQAIDD